ncbi:MAG TPA: MOSC domain-containing protein [Gaiellaceae bacterium]|nr:MOSC domain-containing protein [Gaiellaceae bacterium]
MATVTGLFVSPGRGSGRSESRERVLAREGHGIEGCAHANPPRREVLLASKEHLDALGLAPGSIRENVTVDGVDVHSWRVGQRVRVGEAVLEITMECEPCHRMDELRAGLRTLLEGRRGMLAHVVETGEIAVGDPIELL